MYFLSKLDDDYLYISYSIDVDSFLAACYQYISQMLLFLLLFLNFSIYNLIRVLWKYLQVNASISNVKISREKPWICFTVAAFTVRVLNSTGDDLSIPGDA